jgi:hypothetical protein
VNFYFYLLLKLTRSRSQNFYIPAPAPAPAKSSGSLRLQLHNTVQKCTDFKKFAFLRCLDYLHFKCIFHKEAGSGSDIEVKVGSGSEKKYIYIYINNNFGSTTLLLAKTWQFPFIPSELLPNLFVEKFPKTQRLFYFFSFQHTTCGQTQTGVTVPLNYLLQRVDQR